MQYTNNTRRYPEHSSLAVWSLQRTLCSASKWDLILSDMHAAESNEAPLSPTCVVQHGSTGSPSHLNRGAGWRDVWDQGTVWKQTERRQRNNWELTQTCLIITLHLAANTSTFIHAKTCECNSGALSQTGHLVGSLKGQFPINMEYITSWLEIDGPCLHVSQVSLPHQTSPPGSFPRAFPHHLRWQDR